jgi:hypothetical protein
MKIDRVALFRDPSITTQLSSITTALMQVHMQPTGGSRQLYGELVAKAITVVLDLFDKQLADSPDSANTGTSYNAKQHEKIFWDQFVVARVAATGMQCSIAHVIAEAEMLINERRKFHEA